jgi:prepilin-type N-terminal cleavage/methylation domain-containing protein
MINLRKQFGFSLIEIMVVVTIMVVMGGMMFAGYNKARDRQRVERGAELFATELRKIQAKADAGELAGCGEDALDYYEVKVATACDTTATVTPYCADTGNPTTNTQEIVLSGGLQFAIASEVKFYSQGRGTDSQTTFAIDGNNNCRRVIIELNQTGRISTGECLDDPVIECS